MKILVTGAGGQLGYDVCRELARRNVEVLAASRERLDVTCGDGVKAMIAAHRPDGVIHCAAYTAVDKAEGAREQCWLANVQGTWNVALACRETGARMLYVSTDYVFSGAGNRPYETTDPVNPLSVYGQTKLAGELAVKTLLDRYFIVRTSWVFGGHGNNFVKTMLRLGKEREQVDVVCDQVGSPTYTVDLAPLLCDMVTTRKYGVYHATNEGVCSWAEFAREIFRAAGLPTKVNGIPAADYGVKTRRPYNSRLSKERLEQEAFLPLPHWKDALERFLQSQTEENAFE